MVLEADGTIRYGSLSEERVLGYDPRVMVGEKAFGYIHPDDRERTYDTFSEVLETPGPHGPVEYRFRHRDGSWLWLEALGNDLLRDPSVGGIVVNSRDVIERKACEERLEHQAFHDPLTGLLNRALLSNRFEQAAGRADRSGKHLAILYLDLDGFKGVNDSLGHEAGDRLLVAVAERLGAHSRLGDTVARLGGDEFCVLAEDVGGAQGAARVAGRVRGGLREPFLVESRRISVSVSIGAAMQMLGEDVSLDRLLREADAAMYRAKKEKSGETSGDPAG